MREPKASVRVGDVNVRARISKTPVMSLQSILIVAGVLSLSLYIIFDRYLDQEAPHKPHSVSDVVVNQGRHIDYIRYANQRMKDWAGEN